MHDCVHFLKSWYASPAVAPSASLKPLPFQPFLWRKPASPVPPFLRNTKVQGKNPELFHSHKDSGINLQVGQLLKDGNIQQCYCRPEVEADWVLPFSTFCGWKWPWKVHLFTCLSLGWFSLPNRHCLERDFDVGFCQESMTHLKHLLLRIKHREFNYQLALWRHEVKRTYLRSLRTVRKNGACSIHDIGWKIRFRYTCRWFWWYLCNIRSQ